MEFKEFPYTSKLNEIIIHAYIQDTQNILCYLRDIDPKPTPFEKTCLLLHDSKMITS